MRLGKIFAGGYFCLQAFNCIVQVHRRLLFRSNTPNCDRLVTDFSLADGHQDRYLGNTVLANFVRNLFVAEIGFRGNAGSMQFGNHLRSIVVGLGCDR